MENLNTLPIQQFIQSVKQADSANQKEIRISIQNARNLAYSLGMVMSRLEGDLEKILSENKSNEIIEINLDPGTTW